jgi:hypothetical protein
MGFYPDAGFIKVGDNYYLENKILDYFTSNDAYSFQEMMKLINRKKCSCNFINLYFKISL